MTIIFHAKYYTDIYFIDIWNPINTETPQDAIKVTYVNYDNI